MHKRCLEHMEAIRRGDVNSGMAMHIKEAHPDTDLEAGSMIEMTLVQQRQKNMERGIAEAVLIEEIESNCDITTTNRKAEWGRASIRRLTTQGSLQ